jgi:hypothetical protein
MEGAAEMAALHRKETAAEMGNNLGDGRRVEIAALHTVDERAASETGVCMGGGGVLLAMEGAAKMVAHHR